MFRSLGSVSFVVVGTEEKVRDIETGEGGCDERVVWHETYDKLDPLPSIIPGGHLGLLNEHKLSSQPIL